MEASYTIVILQLFELLGAQRRRKSAEGASVVHVLGIGGKALHCYPHSTRVRLVLELDDVFAINEGAKPVWLVLRLQWQGVLVVGMGEEGRPRPRGKVNRIRIHIVDN